MTAPAPPSTDPLQERPFSEEAERAVLASLLLDDRVIAEVEQRLDLGDFYLERHRLIYAAVEGLRREWRPIDLRTLQEQLERDGALEAVGGVAYLAALDLDLPDLARTEHYAQIVRELSVTRQLMAHLQRLQVALAERRTPGAVGDALLEAQRLVDSAAVEVSGGTLADYVDAAVARYRAIRDGGPAAGLRTGFPGLDDELVGLGRREVVVVAGFTSSGKTTFLEQLADHWLDEGETVAYVSTEMGHHQLTDRQFSRLMGVDQRQLRTGRYDAAKLDRAVERLTGEGGEWAQRLVWLFPRSTEVTEVEREVMTTYRVHPFSVLVIDHLHDLTARAARGNLRVQAVLAAELAKRLARQLDVPVVAAAQVSREGVRDGSRPRLWHLLESSRFEQLADTILMLHRPPDGLLEVELAKVRQGEAGRVVAFTFDPRSRQLRETSWRRDDAGDGPPPAPGGGYGPPPWEAPAP